MTQDEWQEVRALFHSALELPPGDRAGFLRATGVDLAIAAEVQRLLDHSVQSDILQKEPVLEKMREAIDAAFFFSKSDNEWIGRLAGTVIAGRYQLDSVIGRGGHAAVFLASDLRIGEKKVVVKILDPREGNQEWLLRRFRQEISILGRIDHPGVVGIRDCGEIDGNRPFLVLDFVDGETLRTCMRRGLEPSECAEIVRQTGSALKAAHSQGIVHCDVKPENIMIQRDPDSGSAIVKLIDFGIARLERPESSGMTATVTIAGTRKYMAPEQFMGLSRPASDVYSLAVICFEMLTGVTPADTVQTIDPPPSAARIPALVADSKEIPARAHQLLTDALAFDPRTRTSEAEEFGEAFATALEAGSPPDSGSPPLQLPKRRASKKWTIAIGAAVAVFAGVFLAIPRSRPATGALGAAIRLTPEAELSIEPSLDAAGDLVAYASDGGQAGPTQIWVRRLPRGIPRRITNLAGGAREPSVSPDGRSVAFRAVRGGGGIFVVAAEGGNPREVAPQGQRPRFSPDGKRIAYWIGEEWGGTGKVMIVPTAGGTPQWLLRTCGFTAGSPVWAPDGKHIAYWCEGQNGDDRFNDWFVSDVETGRAVRTGALFSLRRAGLAPLYQFFMPIAWTEAGIFFPARFEGKVNVWGVSVDKESFGIRWEHIAIVSPTGQAIDVAQSSNPAAGAGVFESFDQDVQVWRLPVEHDSGRVTGSAEQLTTARGTNYWPDVSADGKVAVFRSDRTPAQSIWARNLEKGIETQISQDLNGGVLNVAPVISPDGSSVAYSAVRNGKRDIYLGTTAPGTGPPRLYCTDCGLPYSFTSDGKGLLFDASYDAKTSVPSQRMGIQWVDLVSGKRQLMPADDFLVRSRLSRDQHWIVTYSILTTETRQIFIIRVQNDRNGKRTLSPRKDWIALTDGTSLDRNPVWSPKDDLVYFLSERDGSRCIWARRVDSFSKRPIGGIFAVYHSHEVRRSLEGVGHETATGLSVGPNALYFSRGERSGGIWLEHQKPEIN